MIAVGPRRLRLAALVLALVATGCAEALYSSLSFRGHEAYSDDAFARYQVLGANGAVRKADVLATLGPPIEVIGQEDGEVFVYRRHEQETTVVNVNPATVSGLGPTVPIPLYFGSRTTGRDDMLMVFFDDQGLRRGDSLRLGIAGGDAPDGPAARGQVPVR